MWISMLLGIIYTEDTTDPPLNKIAAQPGFSAAKRSESATERGKAKGQLGNRGQARIAFAEHTLLLLLPRAAFASASAASTQLGRGERAAIGNKRERSRDRNSEGDTRTKLHREVICFHCCYSQQRHAHTNTRTHSGGETDRFGESTEVCTCLWLTARSCCRYDTR